MQFKLEINNRGLSKAYDSLARVLGFREVRIKSLGVIPALNKEIKSHTGINRKLYLT